MERVTKLALVLSALLFSSVTCAFFSFDNFNENDWQFTPSIGIDVNGRHQRFEGGFGNEHFRRNYPDTNAFLAVRLHCYLGLEVGYEYMYRQQRNQYYPDDVPVLGFNPPLGEDGGPGQKLYFSNSHSNGWNLNLVGFWPICPRTGTDVTFILGVTWLKLYLDTVTTTEEFRISQITSFQSERRAELRLGLGLRQMLTKNFGARLQVLWEKTSNLNATAEVPFVLSSPTANNLYRVEPKNSFLYGLGLFYEFC